MGGPNSDNELPELVTRTGLGIQDVAEMLGVNGRTVRRYINGEVKRLDPLKIEKLREVANSWGRRNSASSISLPG